MINILIATLVLIVFTIIWWRLSVWVITAFESAAGILIIFISGGVIWFYILGYLMMSIDLA